jgi:hypothetical protein
VSTQEGVTEVNETQLGHIAIGMGVAAVLFGMAAVVAKGTALQQLATVSEMAALVAPSAAIGHPSVVGNPSLPDEPLTLQDFCGHQPARTSVR